jgi:ribulose-phosphate 3-epimerase
MYEQKSSNRSVPANKIKIFPSLIAADVLNLQSVIDLLEPHCDGFHIDVMDNHFVPNLTWGPLMVNAIAQHSTKPLFVHLMVDDPESIVKNLQLKPSSIVAFHIESKVKIETLKNYLKQHNLISSLAINPQTDLNSIKSKLSTVDQVLLMSVNPGFSGQKFLESSIDRLKWLNKYKKEHNLDFQIAMDGGITKDNITILAQNGCTIFGIASAIFAQSDPVKALLELYEKGEK